MKEQIDELQKDLCNIPSICNVETYTDCKAKDGSCPKCRSIARDLYDRGYRKQSEGEWVFNRGRTYGEAAYFCSLCSEGTSEYGTDNFCPDCGAHMKGVD